MKLYDDLYDNLLQFWYIIPKYEFSNLVKDYDLDTEKTIEFWLVEKIKIKLKYFFMRLN